MRNPFRFIASASVIGSGPAVSVCPSPAGPKVDPIFNAAPGGRYACAKATDSRNPLVRNVTGPADHAVPGGTLGGLIGNQFSNHTGQGIAIGAYAAAGVTAGAWKTNRMADKRYPQRLQNRQSGY